MKICLNSCLLYSSCCIVSLAAGYGISFYPWVNCYLNTLQWRWTKKLMEISFSARRRCGWQLCYTVCSGSGEPASLCCISCLVQEFCFCICHVEFFLISNFLVLGVWGSQFILKYHMVIRKRKSHRKFSVVRSFSSLYGLPLYRTAALRTCITYSYYNAAMQHKFFTLYIVMSFNLPTEWQKHRFKFWKT